MDTLKVFYQVYIYSGDALQCDYITEYPKDLKEKVRVSKELADKLGIQETYRYFIRTYKNDKPCECFEVTEKEII